tara:strand:- start:263 stop:1087 length:825 start_codon:yes stop_codon:yes gene_type:complete
MIEYNSKKESLKAKDKVLIVGGNGQIGKELYSYLKKKNINVFKTTRDKKLTNRKTFYFDLEKPSYEFIKNQFTAVVICAGATNISLIAKKPRKFRNINVINTIKLIKELSKKKIFIIFLSSNSVFDGKKQFYKHSDKICPINFYGKYKCEVEKYLNYNLKKKSCILRLTKVISKNTPLIKHWNRELNKGKIIWAYKDRFIAPVKILKVIQTIAILIKKKQNGIFQLSGKKEISNFEFAKYFYKKLPAFIKLIKSKAFNKNGMTKYNSLKTHLPD